MSRLPSLRPTLFWPIISIALVLAGARLALAAPPSNDDVNAATVIGSLPFTDTIDTTEATTAPDDLACFQSGATVWYQFTPGQDTRINADTTGSSYSASIAVAVGAPGALSLLTCGGSSLVFQAQASTAYYFMVAAAAGGYPPPGGATGGTLVFSVTEITAPANDGFDDAAVISALPFSDTVFIAEATTEPGEPQVCNFLAHTAWYAFTPSAAGLIRVDTSRSNFTLAQVVVYQATGPGFGGLSFLGCSPAPGSFNFNAEAGVTYYFQAGSLFSNSFDELALDVSIVPPPPNDDFAAATVIPALPFSENVDLTGATREADEPNASCGSSGGSAWYAFTPTESGSLTARTDGFTFFPLIAVYTGNSLSTLTQVGCVGGLAFRSLTFQAQAGTTYYFQVEGPPISPGSSSNLQFSLEVAPPPIAVFGYFPSDPSIFETIGFFDNSTDPGQAGFQSQAWDFGDGATATGCCPERRYAADGDYTVTLTVTTTDGRTASTSQVVAVRTHDVVAVRVATPASARAGQTRTITVDLLNERYAENVEVQLYKSAPGGLHVVAFQSVAVPARANRLTRVDFSYTFTDEDAAIGKVTFKAIVIVTSARDVLPADNEAIAPPVRVSR